MHPRTALRPLIADHNDIARLDLAAENRAHRIILTFEHPRFAGEFQNAVVHARRFHDTTALGDVAEQNGQTAILGKRVLNRTDHTVLTVGVEFLIAILGGEGLCCAHPPGAALNRCSASGLLATVMSHLAIAAAIVSA